MVTRVPIVYEIDTANARREARGLANDLKALREQLGDTNQQGQNAEQQTSAIGAAFSRLRRLLPIASVGALGVGFLGLQNRLVSLQNRLRPVTADTAELGQVYERLDDIAVRTFTTLEENVQTYARLRVATRDLGLSIEETLEVQETLNNLQRVSVSSSEEAAAALRQFNQALSSGRFQGDELRSVLENLPDLARIIADELGVTIGELRELGAAGQLTSDVLITALQGASAEVQELANNQAPELGRSFRTLSDQLLDLGSRFTDASTSGLNFAAGIDIITRGIESAEGPMLRFGRAVGQVVSRLRALAIEQLGLNAPNQGRGPDIRGDAAGVAIETTPTSNRIDFDQLVQNASRFRPQDFPVDELIRRQQEAARLAQRTAAASSRAASRIARDNERAAQRLQQSYQQAFQQAGNAIANFVQRGEFNLRSFVNLAIDLLSSSGIGGTLASAIFGGTNAAGGLGPLNIIGGGAGGGGFGGSFLGGFQAGGEVRINGTGAADSVRVSADVSPGERIRFIPPGASDSEGGGITIQNVFNGIDPSERVRLEALLDARDEALRRQIPALTRDQNSRNPQFLRPRGA